uniref:taste receptor type 2 member 39-like n=1 Tax=Euleptes europaea TaxID=460621 RepID=UPI00254020BD|nr:taste receptor type 2 member 39-like [Euleptes europaea]
MAASLIKIIGFTLLVIESLIGIVANGFIVLMNYIDWFKSRKLSPADLIQTCLGLSRLAFQAVVLLDVTLYSFSLSTHILNYLNRVNSVVWVFTNTANVWFATWLSVFYFAKISIFSHPVFLQVKQRISGLVPRLLLGSVFFSAIKTITLVTAWSDGLSTFNFNSSHLSTNGSEIKRFDFCRYLDIVANASNVIPLLIFLSSSILLITSLWKHTRRLQRNGTGVRDLNTQVHLTAIKALASFSVLYLSSYLAFVAQAILILNNMDHTWPMMLTDNVIAAYPSGHAVILILINPKLKQTWVRMLHHLQCCLIPKDLP